MEVKILIAEDSAADRLIIKSMLENHYIVMTACDGLETMHMLNEHDDINILILDLNMPKMDGFQVLEAIKCSERFMKLRTIILTSYDEPENEIRGLKLGAVDFIRKPVHMYSLKTRIDVHASLLCAEHALEQRLSEHMLTFDMIFNQAPIGIAIIQELKNSDKPVIRVNPMFEKITGITGEELERTGWEAITHPDDLEEELKNYYNEFNEFKDKCRFIGCMHLNEPGCAVKEALNEGKISSIRYDNYRALYEELKDIKKY